MRTAGPDIPIDESRAFRRLLRRLRRGEAIDWTLAGRECPSLISQFKDGVHAFERVASRRAYWDASFGSLSEEPPASPPIDLLARGLPGYEITMEVGRGGQGVVYEAVQKATKRRVAVKLLLDGPLASKNQHDRFLREVELVARFHHENVVTVYETGTIFGHPFFVMEFVDGLPIDDHVLLYNLGVRETVTLFCKVCEAVGHAHQRGVIHRDLKPTNILVDSSGEPRILDFGLAKDLDQVAPGHTVTNQVLGTLPYSAPEQVAATAADVDVRTDVYALGVVLFRTLAGAFPYQVMGPPREVMDAIATHEPKGLRKAMEELSPEFQRLDGLNKDLELIVAKALAKDKEHRYQSVAAFAEDLQRHLAGEAVAARAGHNLYCLAKTIRRFRIPAAIAAVFMLVVIASLISVTAAWRKEAEVAHLAQSGLNMASMLRVGQVNRDMGRTDDAVQMLEKAIQIADGLPREDPQIRAQLFDLHHALGELRLANGNIADARRHRASATQFAAELALENPDDIERQRSVGFAAWLSGKIAIADEDWASASMELSRAENVFRMLATMHPDFERHRFDLAVVLFSKGQCERQLDQSDNSLSAYLEAECLLSELRTQNSQSTAYTIELARIEAEIGALYLYRRQAGDAKEAARLLKQAGSRLTDLQTTRAGKELSWEIDRLLQAVLRNTPIAEKRSRREP